MKKGFTLAEVLITLGIIGIVAALTIPNLVANYKNKEFATRAKRAYSLISQAIQKYQSEENVPGDITGLFDTSKTSAEVLTNFSKYFDAPLICLNSNAKECNKLNYQIQFASSYYNSDGSSGYTSMGFPAMILKDGTILKLRQYTSCTQQVSWEERDTSGHIIKNDDGSTNVHYGSEDKCASIIFDTNGTTPPNQFGADVYGLHIRQDGTFWGWTLYGWNSLKSILQGKDPVYSKKWWQ